MNYIRKTISTGSASVITTGIFISETDKKSVGTRIIISGIYQVLRIIKKRWP
ncbi:MAG TPA: hypothetical protein PKE30_04245 [Niabella sp.]|nr:hypothetical protein [Niabella sp.]